MKILFITTSALFPPRTGWELATSEFIKYVSQRHEVDMVVAVPQGKAFEMESARLEHVPDSINLLGCLPVMGEPRYLKLLKFLMLIQPYFMYRKFDHQALADLIKNRDYDFTWISKLAAFGIYHFYNEKQNDLGKVCLGLNDNIVGHQINGGLYFWEYLKRGKLVPAFLLNVFKLPFVFFHERQLLKKADIVHVQTKLEKKRCCRVWNAPSKYVVASIAPKEDLRKCTYQGRHSKTVLLMSQLTGKRGLDTRWFVSKVWTKIVKEVPDAKLSIIGKCAANDPFWQNLPAGVELTDYVEDLPEVFESVRIVTVPTIHNNGLVTRILDGVAAGIPVVTTPQAAMTIDGFTDQVHGYAARGADGLSSAIVRLLNDDEICLEMSRQCKLLADQKNSWAETCRTIEDFLQARVGA